eukprot:gb/GECH01011562.1/.p1 GENE.gb/GECH01011562.1/~~gb/GECH01011562.1/.p1  ORF type:complete len:485 (+),score=119.61 gb/GECH01011562.1/:1-1455(+)
MPTEDVEALIEAPYNGKSSPSNTDTTNANTDNHVNTTSNNHEESLSEKKRKSPPSNSAPDTEEQDRKRRRHHRDSHTSSSPSREHHQNQNHHHHRRQRSLSSSSSSSRRRSSRHRRRTPSPPSAPSSAAPEDKKQRILQRDKHTVFVSNLSLRIDDKELQEFFEERAGSVRDVQVIKDKFSGKSKGVAYVEFAEQDGVQTGLALAGTALQGQSIMVKQTEAEKNLAAQQSKRSGGPTRLYVGTFPAYIEERDLRRLLAVLGPVEEVRVERDEDGESQGYGYVRYRRTEDAKKALLQLNGIQLSSQHELRVGMVMDDTGSGMGELDDNPEGGVGLNANARAALMAKLGARGGEGGGTGTDAGENGNGTDGGSGGGEGGPDGKDENKTRNLLLRNMFNPDDETEPDFDQEIKQDVTEECQKFGPVVHAHVDKFNKQGIVYIRFDSNESAQKAREALNGRWFAGKVVQAEYLSETAYRAKFPDLDEQ